MVKISKKTIVSVLAGVLIATIIFTPILIVMACSNSGVDKISKNAQHYNLVFTNATVPVNMAAMHTWSSTDVTYLWYARMDTFQDKQRVATRMNLVGNAGKKNMSGLPSSEINAMKKQVKEIEKANDENTYTLYLNSYAIKAAMKIMYENKIPESRFRVILCEDGAGDANVFNTFFIPTAERTQETIQSEWTALKESVSSMIAKSKKGNQKWTRPSIADYWMETIAYTTWDNVEYWHQGRVPANMDANIRSEIHQSTVRLWASDAQLSAGDRGLSNELVAAGSYAVNSFKKSMFGSALENLFNVEEGGKKPLIVTGTSLLGEDVGFEGAAGTGAQFETAFRKIKEVFGQEYFFIYKGHPAYPTHEGYEGSVNWKRESNRTVFNRRVKYLADNFDFQIPEQIPADMLMIFYADEYSLNFGGYDSSLFTAAGAGSNHNVVFFITSEGEGAPTYGLGQAAGSRGEMWINGEFDRTIDGVLKAPGFLTPSTLSSFDGFVTSPRA